MSKKSFGKILVCFAVIGACIAVGVAYFTKYRDFQKSLDDDFDDFEDDFSSQPEESSKEENESPVKREYVSIPLEPAETKVDVSIS